MPGLRIAVVAERFPGSGGGISTAHEGLGRLLSGSHKVEFFAFEPSSQPGTADIHRIRGNRILETVFATLLRLKVRRHAATGEISAVRSIGRTIACVRQLNTVLKKFSPDVVITSDDQLPLLGMKLPRRTRVVWVAHHNYTRFMNHPFLPADCPYDLFLAHRLERRAVARCDFAVFPSSYMEQVFRRTLNSTAPGRVIRNVLPPLPAVGCRSQVRQELNLPSDAIGILMPSAGTTVKGARFVPELIRRIQSHAANCFFAITGPIYDSLAPELDYMKAKFSIHTPGSIPRNAALRWTAACNFCISPALLENYSCALLECQTLGLPVVTFDVGGNREIVEHQETGWIADFPDVDALVSAAVRLATDNDLLQSMATASVRRAAHLTDPQTILADWEAVFNELFPTANPAVRAH